MRACLYNATLLESQCCPRLLGIVLKRLWQCCKLFYLSFFLLFFPLEGWEYRLRKERGKWVGVGEFFFLFVRNLVLFSRSHLGPFLGRSLRVWPHLKHSPCKCSSLLMGFQGEHLQSVATDDSHVLRSKLQCSIHWYLRPLSGGILKCQDVKELFTGKLVNQRKLEIQSPVKKHNIWKPASNSLIASVWPSLWQPSWIQSYNSGVDLSLYSWLSRMHFL